jgi:GNAT superfamily N-acetyltransferase
MEVADQVRKALPQDLPEIGSVLNRAFFDDPLFVWSIPHADRRQQFYLDFFTLYAKAYLRHDQTFTTDGEVVAAALWAPPGAEPISDEDAEELGQRIEELPGPDASRFQQLLKTFADHHPHGSYWYLTFMGVTPGRQGQGIGSRLMAPVLERCDREGAPAYLDATSERNKRLYERHGFKAEDPFAAPGGPPLWPMWRQPTSGR